MSLALERLLLMEPEPCSHRPGESNGEQRHQFRHTVNPTRSLGYRLSRSTFVTVLRASGLDRSIVDAIADHLADDRRIEVELFGKCGFDFVVLDQGIFKFHFFQDTARGADVDFRET